MASASRLTFAAWLVAAGTARAEPIYFEPELRPPGAVRGETPRPRPPSPLATTERWGGGLRLTGLSGIGSLPGVNYGAELAGLVRRDELFGELALGRWMPEDRYMVTEETALALDVWTLRGGWASMQMPLRGWLLVEVGEVAGARGMPGVVPRMVMGDTPVQRQWRAAGAGLGVAWPISDIVRLVGALEVAVPLVRQRLMLEQGGAYEPDWMSARTTLGLEVGWR
jgi:hypothetical protein